MAPLVFFLSILLFGPRAAFADEPDVFAFFKEEAQVVTASRQPEPESRAPATVYVVTAEDIRASGAQTLWDALRGVPGVDVLDARTFQGEVSIRGLNRPFGNRTLVLLDGKTVLNGFFDFVNWEAIPVQMDEIDRIEVVEGPASALYGANAVNGVINIITKTPEQLHGGTLTENYGERDAHLGDFVYGGRSGKASYKIGTGWRHVNAFDDADEMASDAQKIDGQLNVDLSDKSKLGVSAGGTNFTTENTVGGTGSAVADGSSFFSRVDYTLGQTRARVFWNRGRSVLRQFPALSEPNLDYDTYDGSLERTFALPADNSLVLGGSYRKNTMRSSAFQPGLLQQDLWAGFFEDRWEPSEKWAVVVSGRFDKPPFTAWVFSPRGSVIYTPVPEQTLRLSAGSAFRTPTLLENYLNFSQTTPFSQGPFTSLATSLMGNQDLNPERTETQELAWNGRFGRVKAGLVGFHYRLRDIIGAAGTLSLTSPPVAQSQSSFVNSGAFDAWGGEASFEAALGRGVTGFANYSYENIMDDPGPRGTGANSPFNKGNAGLRLARGGFTGELSVNAVDDTWWAATPPLLSNGTLGKVPGYVILNLHAGWRFSGDLSGLELGVNAFNLADDKHYEILPSQGASLPGQFGELVRSRWTAYMTYRF